MSERPRAVVLLSGGLDSTTAAAIARSEGFDLFALTVDYGQRHRVEIDSARAVAAALGAVRHVELRVDLSVFGGSALTDRVEVPKDRDLTGDGIPATYVPARNTVFLSLSMAWAEVLGASDIFIGVNALDYSGYPDCRPEFIEAFERLAGLATKAGVEGARLRIHAPLGGMSKAEIIRRGLELGVDYALTHSCYDPDPRGRPCGHCDSCLLRAKGFAEAGVSDPALEAASPEACPPSPVGLRRVRHSPPGSSGGDGGSPRPHSMSNRLYYTDPQLSEFDATVTATTRLDGRPAVTLDATAFYPTSGGQPHDTGMLGDARVIEVIESDAGEIWHVLDREVEVGRRVHGAIDRDRRFDHMQQHTGQHILSAAFDHLHGARTVGFHLGALVSTLDLAVELPAGAVADAEAEANRVVWEDRPVGIRFVDQAEAAALPLRKEPGRGGTLRVIDVEGYDLSACGGTHVRRTGAVGLVAVLSAERLRGGIRVEFVCGGRALRSLRTCRDAVSGCIRHVSVAPDELPAALERLQSESKELRKTLRDLQERLAAYEAGALAAAAEDVSGGRRVVRALEGRDQNALKALALAICSTPGFEAALFTASAPHAAVLARSKDGRTDCAAALKSLLAAFGGRGGGKPELALGGGLTGDLAEILSAARAELDRCGGHRGVP